MSKSKTAFRISAQALANESLYMWTLTFRELLSLKETRKRWNHLLTLIKRRWPELCGLRVFEMHKSHGLHVHLVTNRRIDVNEVRRLASKAGWGRIHVVRVKPERATYLAKYLGKDRPEALKGWRLWAAFGFWKSTRVSDIEVQSAWTAMFRECHEALRWLPRGRTHEACRLANHRYVEWICAKESEQVHTPRQPVGHESPYSFGDS